MSETEVGKNLEIISNLRAIEQFRKVVRFQNYYGSLSQENKRFLHQLIEKYENSCGIKGKLLVNSHLVECGTIVNWFYFYNNVDRNTGNLLDAIVPEM